MHPWGACNWLCCCQGLNNQTKEQTWAQLHLSRSKIPCCHICPISKWMSTQCNLPTQRWKQSSSTYWCARQAHAHAAAQRSHSSYTNHHERKANKINLINMFEKCFGFTMQASLWFIQKEIRLLKFKMLLSLSSTRQHSAKRYLLITCWLTINQKKSLGL